MSDRTKPAVDRDFLRNMIDNDFEFEKELLKIFLENSNRNLAKIETALRDGDKTSWYMGSHAFKGAAAAIGAFPLAELLEHAQKNPEEPNEEKVALLVKIKEELGCVYNFINEEILEK